MPSFKQPLIPAVLAATLVLGGCIVHKDYDWVRVPNPGKPVVIREPAPPPVVIREPAPPAPPPVIVQAPARVEEFSEFDRVYFATDKWELNRPGTIITLERQIAWLQAHPEAKVRIEGNADLRSSAAHNQMLGQRRAEAVSAYLQTHGVAASRITSVSFGSEQPIAAGNDPAALAHNRNVRTVVVSGGN